MGYYMALQEEQKFRSISEYYYKEEHLNICRQEEEWICDTLFSLVDWRSY